MSRDSTSILFRHPSPRVRRTDLRRFLEDLAQRILPGRDVSCLIARDEDLSALNRNFRGKNYPADVLSFPADRPGGRSYPSELAGELAISFDRAAAQAAELGHGVEDELRILMLHGLLHLAGMDHDADAGAMARAEVRWRKRLGLPCGLIERAHA